MRRPNGQPPRTHWRTDSMNPSRIYGWTVTALTVMLLLSTPAGAEEPKQVFRAGAHAMDITPLKYPISVNGGMQDRQAKGAHDRLHARCLVLDDGTSKIVITVCDSCMIPRELLDEAKRRASKATGIPTDHMLISA